MINEKSIYVPRFRLDYFDEGINLDLVDRVIAAQTRRDCSKKPKRFCKGLSENRKHAARRRPE